VKADNRRMRGGPKPRKKGIGYSGPSRIPFGKQSSEANSEMAVRERCETRNSGRVRHLLYEERDVTY
jgi:hypothetical protein